MKKKLIAVMVAASMTASLAACGSSAGTTTTTGAAETTAQAAETGSAAETNAASAETTEAAKDAKETSGEMPDGTGKKIGIITDTGGVHDGSFNQSAWEGLQRAQKDMGIEAQYLESKTDADYIPNIEAFVDEDYDMIICVGYALADALKQEAEANPDVQFAIIDDASLADEPNVTSLTFEQSQASYLVGYVAGKTTKTNKVGFVLGMSTDIMNQFGYGYVAGVLDANPDATVLQNNANSFSDTAAGKTAATQMITNGADVIFHAAGGTGLGVIEACNEAGIWAIGVDSDQSSLAPEHVLTSAMKRVDNAVYDVSKETVEGKLSGGVKVYSLADEGVDLAPTTNNIDPAVLSEVQEIKQQIIDGKITVPKTKDEFEAKYGNVYELDD